jgi:hypothetical protein
VKYQYAAAALAMASLIPPARSLRWTSEKALHGDIVSMPRGDVSFRYPGAPGLASWIAATSPEDAYFFYPYDTILPFLTARQQVSKYDLFVPSYTTPSQYKEACVFAMRHAVWVVIDRARTDLDWIKGVFPRTPDPDPPERRIFEQALETGFKFVAREGAFEIRQRTPDTNENLCIGITE